MHVKPLILHTKANYYQFAFLMLVSRSVQSLVNILRNEVTFANVEQFLSELLPSIILYSLPWWAYLSEEPGWGAISYNISVVAMRLIAPIFTEFVSFLDISSNWLWIRILDSVSISYTCPSLKYPVSNWDPKVSPITWFWFLALLL